jgi:hypothetical protein
MRGPHGRADIASEWEAGGAQHEAAVGVGTAAKSVAPTAAAQQWTFGHHKHAAAAAPRVDPTRPRHGKALQTSDMAEKMGIVRGHGGADHISEGASSWSCQKEQGWVLASPSPERAQM